jgi:adenosylcobalamin-dependent ribonucleoside-triphosphate reductase
MGFAPARSYFAGMGNAVADRTVNRRLFTTKQKLALPKILKLNPNDPLYFKWRSIAELSEYSVANDINAPFRDKEPETRVETWEEVAARVALGNALLEPSDHRVNIERDRMEGHLRNASILMSGRHLQHGDRNQPLRPMEVFTNCSTSATTFLLFYLLLNGSGVGRAYDDALIKADLNKMPIVVCTIGWDHKDVEKGIISGYMTRRDAEHLYKDREITVFDVPDSREGWTKGIELIECMAFEERREDVLILDFTGVRPKNTPIMGMQGRPASGPGPLMGAISAVARLRDAGMPPWRAAMYADHYMAECVLVGGARRAARMATKSWRDETIFNFIALKRGGFLWSSNNSVTIDEEFRTAVKKVHKLIAGRSDKTLNTALTLLQAMGTITKLEEHAYRVLRAVAFAAYHDGTGEPAFINQDRLTQNDEGFEAYRDGLVAESSKFKLNDNTIPLMRDLAETVYSLRYRMITNPCGEITLLILSGYCVIGDVVPFHALNDDDAEDAFRTITRALIRTNLMDCLYSREVKRTNRIGVGITGFHEWAYDRFGYTWHDIIDEARSLPMWRMLSRFKRAVVDEARSYSRELGVVEPHTNTTFKPAGTTSKLFGLTEGAHLPSMREFLRWVQFRNDDPLVSEYAARGYPIKRLKTYDGTTIVGFPTKPKICELDGGDWVVTAAEATPAEQYAFLRLLEKWWITGMEEDDVTPLPESGNQVSYTLKYDPKVVDYNQFLETLIEGQFDIRCCSVMPQSDTSAYEYLPETPVSKHEFEMIASAIAKDNAIKEGIGFEHVDCKSGACPIDFNEEVK